MEPAQLDRLNSAIEAGSVPDRVAWANLLLRDIDSSTLGTVQQHLPALQPDWRTENVPSGLHWKDVDTGLFSPTGIDIGSDLHQGQDGDCWFMSSLAAIAQQSPDFFESRIHENPNGTYTVTFYRDGQPVEVTVDGQLPVNDRDQTVYTNPGGFKWVSLYEKAYAQYQGGYEALDGGNGARTGQAATRTSTGDHSLQEISQWVKDGRAVTTGSRKDGGGLWWDGDGEFIDGNKVVSAHEYWVDSVDLNADPPTITLKNPWGVASATDADKSIGRITLTESEWHEYFNKVSATPVRP
ncbi:C2 family cysteine protease [Catenulispora yoronensis]